MLLIKYRLGMVHLLTETFIKLINKQLNSNWVRIKQVKHSSIMFHWHFRDKNEWLPICQDQVIILRLIQLCNLTLYTQVLKA